MERNVKEVARKPVTKWNDSPKKYHGYNFDRKNRPGDPHSLEPAEDSNKIKNGGLL